MSCKNRYSTAKMVWIRYQDGKDRQWKNDRSRTFLSMEITRYNQNPSKKMALDRKNGEKHLRWKRLWDKKKKIIENKLEMVKKKNCWIKKYLKE